MKALKNLFELLTSIPFLGIILNIFTGKFGVIVPIAFVLQVALQIFCAQHWLQLSQAGTAVVALALCCAHLFLGLLISLQPLDGMGNKPRTNSSLEYVKVAAFVSLVMGGFCTVVVVGLAALISGAGWAVFAETAALSTVGAMLVHMFGVVFPIIRLSKK